MSDKWLPFFVLLLVYGAIAETHLSGDIAGITFESSGNPYIVEQDIVIPEGKRVTIKEGCVFLFKLFTGLIVHGHLFVDGTQEQPVIFTSINENEYNSASEQLPNPFDWNGILVSRESGKVVMKNFSLRFSVYGIKSQNTNIIIDKGVFRQNGQFHFTINDKIQFVQDNIAYSYSIDEPSTDPEKPQRKDSVIDRGTESVKKKRDSRKVFVKKGVPIIIGSAGLVCGGVSLVFLKKWLDGKNAYDATSDPDEHTRLLDEGKGSSAVAITTGTTGIAAIATGVALYIWNNQSSDGKKRITVAPVYGPGTAGVAVVINMR